MVEPENPGNIGAAARVMKNFGFRNLVLVNPACDHLSEDARKRAKHANDILSKAKKISFDKLSIYDYRIGTTSKLGNDFNIPRSPMTPKELSEKLSSINSAKRQIALVFGRESSGLTNKEISKMDFITSIPASGYSALNLSHAIAVLLYEIYQQKNPDKIQKKFTPISRKEIDIILDLIDKVLETQDYSTKEKKETQRLLWKHIATKSMLTRREAFALMGFLRKML